MPTMPTFTLTIETDNAAFEDALATEIARILRDVARRVLAGETPPFKLRDANGNTVGSFTSDADGDASPLRPQAEYRVQGKYPGEHGWETVCTESTRKEALQRLREYNENEPRYPHRIRRADST